MLKNYSKLTHYLAAAIVTVSGFLATPAGIALIHQYPRLAVVASALSMLVALYINPVKGNGTN